MHINDIKLLYDFNDWADARILAQAANVSPEQYAAPTTSGNGHDSLRATLVHMLDNIWQWRITLEGFYAEPLVDDAAYDATELHDDTISTFDALVSRWTVERAAMRAYFDTVTEETLNGTIRYVIPGGVREYVVWHLLMSSMFHAMQHRSEAATLLTQYGQSPGDLDFTWFLRERGKAIA